jgi:sigma-B regulation protein RsbU (phosphoserine phosphatase)
MTMLICGAMAVLYLAAMGLTYFITRSEALRRIEQSAGLLAATRAEELRAEFGQAETVVTMMSTTMDHAVLSTERDIRAFMSEVLDDAPSLYGVCLSFEPGQFAAGIERFAPYVSRVAGKSRFVRLDERFDYLERGWYKLGRSLAGGTDDSPQWTEPYVGFEGQVLVTCAAPFYRGNAFRGVAAADFDLGALSDRLQRQLLMPGSYSFLLSRRGTIVSFPERSLLMKSLRDVDPDLAGALAHRGGSVEARDPWRHAEAWIFKSPMTGTRFDLVVVCPTAQTLAEVRRLQWTLLLIGVGGLLAMVALVNSLSASITRPLSRLADAAGRVVDEGLDHPLPAIRPGDEVGDLAAAFARMIESLEAEISERVRTTAEKERILADLRIAAEIQRSILPRAYPAFPERPEVDVYGLMQPALEVGGDLYEHFLLDEGTLGFMIGDVSGKGVPAALFMAVTTTFVKAIAMEGQNPADCLRRVNEAMRAVNDSMMFVTLFYGVLRLDSGRMTYCNAGHNPPYLRRADGRLEPLERSGDAALGIVEGQVLHGREVDLAPGDRLVLYTDGVTEAFDAAHAMFGSSGLERVVEEAGNADAGALAGRLLTAVEKHSEGVAQSDDITVLVIDYRGPGAPPPPVLTLRMEASMAELERLRRLLAEHVRRRLPSDAADEIEGAVTEAVTNVIRHAWRDGSVHYLSLRAADEGEAVEVEIEDDGAPFDPTAESRSEGGLARMRGQIDVLRYRRRGARNVLTLRKAPRRT